MSEEAKREGISLCTKGLSAKITKFRQAIKALVLPQFLTRKLDFDSFSTPVDDTTPILSINPPTLSADMALRLSILKEQYRQYIAIDELLCTLQDTGDLKGEIDTLNNYLANLETQLGNAATLPLARQLRDLLTSLAPSATLISPAAVMAMGFLPPRHRRSVEEAGSIPITTITTTASI